MNVLWKKRLYNGGWLLLTITGLILLVAAIKRKNNNTCGDLKVELSGSANNFFIDEKEVVKLLNANGMLKGKKTDEINLRVLENRLENDTWIANAELFFDKDEVLNVKVEEREPVARVFTTGGNSFYLDSSCKRLPVSDKVSVRVPMFTGFPSNAHRLRTKDSVLLASVKELAGYIKKDPFWNAQVAQVDITPDRTFEMIPTLGNHIVVLGQPNNYDEKFGRLYTFYKRVWTKVGLEKYSRIDVQFTGQVVATRRGEGAADIDSLKAKEAFNNLMQENRRMQQEEPVQSNTRQVAVKTAPGLTQEKKDEKAQEKKPAERPLVNMGDQGDDKPVPRAVMPKKVVEQ